MGRWGDGERGRWGEGEMGRGRDGERERWGDGEMGKKQRSIVVSREQDAPTTFLTPNS
jgi:hypothetical protein